MSTSEADFRIDLTEALETFERLQFEGGDLGALYWHKISELLKSAEIYRAQALAAELKLERIRAIINSET